MIGIDTNALVRYFKNDNPGQTLRATRWIDALTVSQKRQHHGVTLAGS